MGGGITLDDSKLLAAGLFIDFIRIFRCFSKMALASIVYFNKLLEILETSKELRRSFVGICKQVAYTAAGTAIGGVCAGPVGAVAGAAVGESFI